MQVPCLIPALQPSAPAALPAMGCRKIALLVVAFLFPPLAVSTRPAALAENCTDRGSRTKASCCGCAGLPAVQGRSVWQQSAACLQGREQPSCLLEASRPLLPRLLALPRPHRW